MAKILTPEELDVYQKELAALKEFFELTNLHINHRKAIFERKMGEIYPEKIVYKERLKRH